MESSVPEASETAGFVEVVAKAPSIRSPSMTSAFQVRLPSGIEIEVPRFPPDFDSIPHQSLGCPVNDF